ALERMKRRFTGLISESPDLGKIRQGMVDEAKQIHLEKRATDQAIGSFGAEFMPREGQVMTQCNAGALATAGIGTALGVIRMAFASRPMFPPPIPLSTLPPPGTSRPSSRNAASPARLMPIHFALSPLPATLLPPLAANRVAIRRDWISYSCFMEAPACVMLPCSKSVLMVIF